MTYATQQDLEDRFGSAELLAIADRDNSGQVDAAVITLALEDADAKIDTYLAKRYTLPLAETPRVITSTAADIARFRLYAANPPDDVRAAFDQAMRYLKDLSSGAAELETPAGAAHTPAGKPVQTAAPDRIFTSDTLKDFTG